MPPVQRPEDLHPLVMARLNVLTAAVCQRIPGFERPSLGYFTGRRAAGIAYFAKHRIELHAVLLRENLDDMLGDTLPHELAHLVAFRLRGERGHGRHWQGVMRVYFGIEPTRCHDYAMANAGVRRQRRWLYTCGCPGRELHITTVRHNRMQVNASRFRCRTCHQPIVFADQRVS